MERKIYITISDMEKLFGPVIGKSLYSVCYENLPTFTRMSIRRFAVADIIELISTRTGLYHGRSRRAGWKLHAEDIQASLQLVLDGHIKIGKEY